MQRGHDCADLDYMRLALQEAEHAFANGEVPVGAIIVRGSTIIGSAHNQRESLRDPTAHAEMLAIPQAAEASLSWRLEDCTLFVTLEPCPMCAGASVLARIPRVVYGAADPKAGAVQSLFQLLNDSRLNHRAQTTGGVLADECGAILTRFFREHR